MDLNDAIKKLNDYRTDNSAVVFRGSSAMADFLRDVQAAMREAAEHCEHRCFIKEGCLVAEKLRTLAGKVEGTK